MRAGWMMILFSCFAISCEKAKLSDNLPPITQSGKHHLGFKVNQQNWTPFDKGYYKDYELPVPTLSSNNGVVISATKIDENHQCRTWFCIEVEEDIFSKRMHALTNTTCAAPLQTYYYGSNKHHESQLFMMDTNSEHSINFTKIDTVQNIIAGTFQFNAYSAKGDTLKIRDGRFDLKLQK
jgi:hypothetical protein